MKRSIWILGLTLGLSACGVFKEKDKGRKGDEIKTELTGRWLSACEPKGPLGLIELVGDRYEMNFSVVPGDLVKTIHRYSDKDCATPLVRQDITATYAVIGAAEQVAGAQNLNITVHKVALTPVGADSAAKLNDAKLCGATDWQDAVTKDVTGLDCAGKHFAAGQVVFDIYDVDGNNLYLGKSSFFRDGNSAEARPTELDREHPLAKQ